uniref:Uncharacterized protein n=1 Tax=Spongospora subterranea TaxID=70186 RepID=A0A0H5QFY3_9EUKA|eukprot:CRZ00850.1 hypothetical protein [Spongospora subterranea]
MEVVVGSPYTRLGQVIVLIHDLVAKLPRSRSSPIIDSLFNIEVAGGNSPSLILLAQRQRLTLSNRPAARTAAILAAKISLRKRGQLASSTNMNNVQGISGNHYGESPTSRQGSP